MEHRRWLDDDYNCQKDYSSFDGMVELEHRSRCLSGDNIVQQLKLEEVENKFGKIKNQESKNRKQK